MRWHFLALFALALGCANEQPPASLAATVTDSAGIQIVTLDRPLAMIALGAAGRANDTATILFTVDSLTDPVAAAFLASGGLAIVERAEKHVSLVDPSGAIHTTLGRPGDGPGEFRLPAAAVVLGNDLVVLQSRPTNTLTRFREGAPPIAAVPPIPGDWSGWLWHRPDIGLEFPGQSAPEIWSRRLRALDDSTFLAYVAPIEEDTSPGAEAHLLRFGQGLALLDTFATLPTPPREQRPSEDPRGAPQLFEPIWAPRAVWGAAEGRVALGWGGRSQVELHASDAHLTGLVRWPAAGFPVTPDDQRALGDQILRVTLAASPSAAENMARMSKKEIEAQMKQFLGTFTFAPMRPELVALFVADGCLWLAGFDPADNGDGTSHEWLVLDLLRPTLAPRVVTIGAPQERVLAIGQGRAATVRLEDDGFRRVRVYRVPTCAASAS